MVAPAQAAVVSGNWNDLDGTSGKAPAFPGQTKQFGGPAGPDTALLLTDGSVVVHEVCSPNWHRLIPDQNGSYIKGSWSTFAKGDNNNGSTPLAQMNGAGTAGDYGPLFYASQVLPDGRLIVMGGEYENNQTSCGSKNAAVQSTKGSLYNPHTNTWTMVPCPGSNSATSCSGSNAWTTIGDAGSVLLGPNTITGTYAPASFFLQNSQTIQAAVASIAAFPGTTVTWTQTNNGKADGNDEEGWTLLPNGTVLAVDIGKAPGAELFFPGQNCPTSTQCNGQWVSAGSTAPNLVNTGLGEIGPAVSIGFNMVVQFGGNGGTSIFVYPTGNIGSNLWTPGPSFPNSPQQQEVADGPAALLPNGNILVQASFAYTTSPPIVDGRPSHFYEFDTVGISPQYPCGNPANCANRLPAVNDPSCAPNTGSFEGRMLVLPATADAQNGQVLWDAGEGFSCASIYVVNSTDGTPNRVMRPLPHISSISSTTLTRGSTYTLTGSMFRDVSQGGSYGDNAQMSTNYPIVRITNNSTGHVCWGRSHDWAIWTSTQFDVPPDNTGSGGNSDWALVENPCDTAGGGASTLVVIVNGLVSNSMAVTIQ
jgi:hypothetical protein